MIVSFTFPKVCFCDDHVMSSGKQITKTTRVSWIRFYVHVLVHFAFTFTGMIATCYM